MLSIGNTSLVRSLNFHSLNIFTVFELYKYLFDVSFIFPVQQNNNINNNNIENTYRVETNLEFKIVRKKKTQNISQKVHLFQYPKSYVHLYMVVRCQTLLSIMIRIKRVLFVVTVKKSYLNSYKDSISNQLQNFLLTILLRTQI